MTIKGQEYLYLSPDGVWQFQIYVPAYRATLKEKGLIKRIGSNKSGHWEIIE